MSETQDMIKFREILETYCRRDRDAIKLCEDFLYVAHVWDDLYDRDKSLSAADINRAFCKALAGISQNPLYQEHVREFSALSLITAMTWQIANKFEKGNADELLGSFVLRNSLMNLIYFVILITGAKIGDELWGVDIGEHFFREMFDGFHGKYLSFLSEMRVKNESNNQSSDRHGDRQRSC